MNSEPAKDDGKRFTWLAMTMTALVLFALSANAVQDTLLSGAGEYVKRRLYFERVLSGKGLRLHEGSFWKEKE